MSIFKPINNDLDKVNDKLIKEYLIKAGHLSSFAHINLTPLNAKIRPAMVIISSRLFNYMSPQVISLAAVVQFIYMASMIHFGISNNSEGKRDADPRDGTQFPVLVGDFLYGKFFTSLCNAQIVEYLKPLSQVICSIHEGGILRYKSAPLRFKDISKWEEIAYKETGTLFETGCRLAADLARASDKDQNNIAGFARELGIIYGLIEDKVSYDVLYPHFEKAKHFLRCLPQNGYNLILKELLTQLEQDTPVLTQKNG